MQRMNNAPAFLPSLLRAFFLLSFSSIHPSIQTSSHLSIFFPTHVTPTEHPPLGHEDSQEHLACGFLPLGNVSPGTDRETCKGTKMQVPSCLRSFVRSLNDVYEAFIFQARVWGLGLSELEL